VLFLLWISTFFFFTLICALVLYQLNKSTFQIEKRIIPLLSKPKVSDELAFEQEIGSFKERIILPLVKKIRVYTLGTMKKNKMKELEKQLRAAGQPFGLTAVDFRMAQFLISTSFFIITVLFFLPNTEQAAQVFLLAIFAGGFGMVYPTYYLNAKKKQRIRVIESRMPDFFDMITVSVEAGLGLDGALKKVCKQIKGPISEEFIRTLDEMKLGQTRKRAFVDLRERIPSESFQSVINALIQADQMGIGMAKVLRAQTQRIREKQRQRAKEQAMKAPVKMMIPMVLFIFPTLFVVLLGPIVVQAITNWF
jgi:tight adherence protein C